MQYKINKDIFVCSYISHYTSNIHLIASLCNMRKECLCINIHKPKVKKTIHRYDKRFYMQISSNLNTLQAS